MATKTASTGRRSLAHFPEVSQAQHRLDDLYAKFNAAREQLLKVEGGAPKPRHVREQDHVDALLAGADPDALDLEADKAHAQRVADAEKTVHLLEKAIETQTRRVNETRGEASGAILRERRAEIFAKMRSVIGAILQLLRARDEEQAFRFQLDQEGIAGAETVWSLPFFAVHQFGSLTEPDSAIVRILRDAVEVGVLTPAEVASIRAGGDLPSA